jgi:allantoinase
VTALDLIVRGGAVVTPAGVRVADVGVAGGRIAAVEDHLDAGAAEEVDARGLHVLPGGLDPHVHFNEPGRAHWEGLRTGSRALAAGGVTAFFDMPLNSTPPTIDARGFDLKLVAARAASLVDFGLWGGLVPGNLDRLEELADRGVVAVKAFMANSGIEDFPAVDDLTLYEGMARCAQLGLMVAVHAESDRITAGLAARAAAEGRTGARDFMASRPVVAELEAIGRAIVLAEETGCALHVVHVSSGRGVALVAEARRRGVDVSCETCPHYLVLGEEDVEALGAVAKCAPPVRGGAERERLWEQLRGGALPMVTSDHSPSAPELKDTGDFLSAWGGIAGCQTTLPVMLTEGHHERAVALETLVRVLSTAAAQRFAVPGKGRLEAGADADLALIDLAADHVLRADDLHYRHRASAWVGRRLRARVVRTVLRGETVFADGRIVGPPRGRLLTPRRAAPAGRATTSAVPTTTQESVT